MTTEDPPATPSTPAPASVVLPLTFSNSFWSADYATGAHALYTELERGITASQEITDNVRRRANAERLMANELLPPALRPDGFGANEGASLRVGYESVLTAQVSEARARRALANDLERTIATPFEHWSTAHNGRVASSRSLIDGHLATYEKGLGQVNKLKGQYDEACRAADAAEDELNFNKGQPTPPTLSITPPVATSSPPLSPPTATRSSSKSSTRKDDEETSEDGISPTADDDDDAIIGRDGLAPGSSIKAALGRALTTVRRKVPTPATATGEGATTGDKELPTPPPGGFVNEQKVEAAVEWSRHTFSSLLERVAGPQTGEGRNERARKLAEDVEAKYKLAVEHLDQNRLTLEEALHEHYSYLHRCESDRIKAASSVLRSFHVAVAALPKLLIGSHERVGTTLELLRPEKDVGAIIERSRTGPFQPRPTTYASHYSEPAIAAFGIDLRKFDETNTSENKVPPVLSFLLEYISEKYQGVSDSERRKSWLYETPLAAQHALRQALNSTPSGPFHRSIIERFDLPVVVSIIKLWFLELEIPPIPFTHYDEYRALYPKRVGAEVVDTPIKIISDHLSRIPPVHLEVLRALITHFSTLLTSTKTDEPDEVYLQKLSLSLSRTILRPRQETPLTLDDRFPALLFADLVKSEKEIFESADLLKSKQREDRYKPRRQRTKPIDARISRSKLAAAVTTESPTLRGQELLKEQLASPPPTSNPPRLTVPVPSAPPADDDDDQPLATSPGAITPVEPSAPEPTKDEEKEVVEEEEEGEQPPEFAPDPESTIKPSAATTIPEPSAPPAEPEPEVATAATVEENKVGGGGSSSISRSSRLRGARGPRPPSVSAAVAKFEGKE